MKKKLINQIAYSIPDYKNISKDIKQIITVRQHKLSDSEHLFIEIYDIGRTVPKIRIVINREDWINYKPESGTWTHSKIADSYYSSIHDTDGHTYISKKETATIKKFGGEYLRYTYNDSIKSLIYSIQCGLAVRQQQKKDKKRREKLENMISITNGYSEGFDRWIKDRLDMTYCNFLYYKRKGSSRADIQCSACGEKYEIRFKNLTFEENTNRFNQMKKPAEGMSEICPACKKPGIYKTVGRAKGLNRRNITAYDIIRYEKGICVKYITAEKITAPGIKGRYDTTELVRSFFEESSRMSAALHISSIYTERDEWVYSKINAYCQGEYRQKPEQISPGGIKTLKESHLKYSGYDEYIKNTTDSTGVVRYLREYVRWTGLEMAVKAGAYSLVSDLCGKNPSLEINKKGSRLNDILLIRKERMKYLKSKKYDKMVLETEKVELDKRIAEVKEKYPEIAKKYKKLDKKYGYSDETYIIRPAKEAGEIVMEGRRMHHCVGGDNYLMKHNNGETFILFLRRSAEPDTPYVTIEIRDNYILQWYQAYDKKPDKDIIQPILDKYINMLEAKKNKQKISTQTERKAG